MAKSKSKAKLSIANGGLEVANYLLGVLGEVFPEHTFKIYESAIFDKVSVINIDTGSIDACVFSREGDGAWMLSYGAFGSSKEVPLTDDAELRVWLLGEIGGLYGS